MLETCFKSNDPFSLYQKYQLAQPFYPKLKSLSQFLSYTGDR